MWCQHQKFNYTYDLIKDAFLSAGLHLTKVTHAFRGSGARIALENGCTLKDVECIGHWNPNKMRQCYTTVTPTDALLKMGEHGLGFHFLARTKAQDYASPDLLECVRREVFPWAEGMRSQLPQKGGLDLCGMNFLNALIEHGRDIVLQDLAVLLLEYPFHPYVSRSPLTKHKDFLSFASKIRDLERSHNAGNCKRDRVDDYIPDSSRFQRPKVEGLQESVESQLSSLQHMMTELNAKINMALCSQSPKCEPHQPTGLETSSSNTVEFSPVPSSGTSDEGAKVKHGQEVEWEVSLAPQGSS